MSKAEKDEDKATKKSTGASVRIFSPLVTLTAAERYRTMREMLANRITDYHEHMRILRCSRRQAFTLAKKAKRDLVAEMLGVDFLPTDKAMVNLTYDELLREAIVNGDKELALQILEAKRKLHGHDAPVRSESKSATVSVQAPQTWKPSAWMNCGR